MTSPLPPADALLEALRAVVDPELGEDVVSLGMVRSVDLDESGVARVEIALTVASCPLRTQLHDDVVRAGRTVPGVTAVEVSVGVMEPAERAELMSRARLAAQSRSSVAVQLSPTTRVLAVASGKGGVGKSSVTVNLAVALAGRGLTVGLLDADVWGHSVPRLLGLSGELTVRDKKMVPLERVVAARTGGREGVVRVVSMGFLSGEDDAIMWRGLVLNRAVQHFLEDVEWGPLDYLLIDLPPGTGDVQMGLARMLGRTEVLVVTTPPLAAQKVAGRAAAMARKGHLRVAGVIENMSPFHCDSGVEHAVFGRGGGARLAAELGVPLLGELPLDPAAAEAGDAGEPVALGEGELAVAVRAVADRLATEIAPPIEASGCTARMLDRIAAALG